MEIQRLKSAGEGWGSVIQSIYMLTAFPCALLIGTISAFMAPSLYREGAYSTLLFFAVIWLAAILPIVLFARRARSGGGLIENVLKTLRSDGIFFPDASLETRSSAAGKYLGIDARNGTILYIHKIRKGQVDVVGLTMGDWTNREVEGNKLRLYTKFPELPCIEISTPWAQRWYDTLGAMEYKRYTTAKPFGLYVREHAEKLERENKIHIPKLG
ncbi:ethanolamine utilization protein EutG [Pseudomonas syringae]|uniref:plasmid IncI1-type surface exclusion protein ExcA n=1 Tax=Pseudomonas syringae TaxID=317 RepID=UPI00101075C9|nr:plasmid IncI1-type surface exclusion protein ExcA [Pseudomonas syringae]RXU01270.1 ethanolamine utilization protein EutG [Pseudomonas syringae]